MNIQEKIAERARKIYEERYGKRSPASLSSQEIEKVNHDAMVLIQKEIKKGGRG